MSAAKAWLPKARGRVRAVAREAAGKRDRDRPSMTGHILPRAGECTPQEWVRYRVKEADRGHSSPCWIWQSGVDNSGYGTSPGTRILPPHTRAHRIAYAAFVGPIPDGFEIDHLCNVRLCCNPAHLEAVTKEENNRRSMPQRRLAMRALRRTHCIRGHELTPENSRYRKDGGRQCRTCVYASNKRGRQRARAS
jgi:hypothetical protein